MKRDLSDAFIKTIAAPLDKKKKNTFTSAFLSGLTLVVSLRPSVDKFSINQSDDITKYCRLIWRFRYTKADGKRSMIDLGFWPAMNQDAAVVAGREMLAAVASGRDLVKERLAKKEQVLPEVNVSHIKTIAYLLHQFIEHRNKRYPDKMSTTIFYQNQINNHLLPRWGLFSIDNITQWTWQEYIRELRLSHTDTVAKKVHSTMRAALSFAVHSDEFYWVGANVLLGLPVVSELKIKPKERFLSHEELHQWMNELTDRPVST